MLQARMQQLRERKAMASRGSAGGGAQRRKSDSKKTLLK